MPILHNAQKALRKSVRQTQVNKVVKTKMKTAITKMIAAKTLEALSEAYSRIDRAVKGKIIHKNKAAHLKHQMSKLVVAQAEVKPKVKKAAAKVAKAAKPKKKVAKK